MGQGNCILVVAEVANNESLDSKLKEKRALIVDCGTGSGAESNYGDLGKRKFEDKLRELRLQEQRGDTGDTSLAV
ncbi:MAG: hypothetical protein LBQ03_00580 [Puniceicoccales bacterium]|nr:hypothetical protein [Puniceicoccales bacterium]